MYCEEAPEILAAVAETEFKRRGGISGRYVGDRISRDNDDFGGKKIRRQ